MSRDINNSLTLYHTVPTFNDSEKEVFRKHCGKRRKMLVTSIFSFSHNVFELIKNRSHYSNNILFVVRKCFEIAQVQKLSFGKEVNISFFYIAGPILTRLGRNIHWEVVLKNCGCHGNQMEFSEKFF